MRLKSVRVGEFKSVRDSGEFETGDVTCLVGKNEAGKTAALEALYRLRPVIDSHGTFNVTHDYPRTDVEDYEQMVQAGERDPATVVTAVYELSNDEVAEVEGPDFRFAVVPYRQDQSPRLDFWGSDARNLTTEGDTRWVNYNMSHFSSRSTAS